MVCYAKQGVSFDFEENEKGIHCAALIRDASNTIIAAIAIATALSYMPKHRMNELVPLISETARTILLQLGWNS